MSLKSIPEVRREEVGYMAELFKEKGIDYRVIGSRALELYAISTHDQENDIDLIVPRAEIKGIPEVRESLRREFGRRVVLGTLPAMSTVNMVPDGTSELTYRDLRVPLDAPTLKPVEVDGITTLSPQSLAGMYGTIGGIHRKKDAGYRESISNLADEETDPAFSEFFTRRESEYPLYTASKKLSGLLARLIPTKTKLTLQDIIEKGMENRYELY